MSSWPWWLSGSALAGVMLTHWFTTHRMMAVSGRFTAVVNRFRFAEVPSEETPPMTEEELLQAIQAATLEAFGQDGLPPELTELPEGAADSKPESHQDSKQAAARERPMELAPLPSPAPKATVGDHLVFLTALPVGSLVAGALTGTSTPARTLAGTGFTEAFGSGGTAYLALLFGGVLVGFGTRMAGGCTSGHGLCGVSRAQPGSLLATAAFFGAGIIASFLIGAL